LGGPVGTDIDQAKITLAQQQAEGEGLSNVEFRVADSPKTEKPPSSIWCMLDSFSAALPIHFRL